MKTRSTRVSFSSVLLAGLLFLPASSGPAASTRIRYEGDAYGSSASVADVVVSGGSFPVFLGSCGTLRPPVTRSNTGASVNARPQLTTGAVDTTASATEASGTRTSRSTATVHTVNVLSGLITATEVEAVSATSRDGAGFHTSGSGSRLTNLVVAGMPIFVQPGPNTRIELAGFGHVVLNEQVARIRSGSASLVVNMIRVVVTRTNPLVPVGTNIIVAHAKSRLVETDSAGTLDGFAYGTSAEQGRHFLSGPSALEVLGCSGTNGAVRTNSTVGIHLEPGFSLDVVTNTVSGLVTSTSASGETTSTVEALSLLAELVTADLIKADAHAFTDGSRFTFTDTGTAFKNLSVRGFPDIDDDVPPNTMLTLPGLGKMWLRREIFRPNSIEIRMIQVIVNQANDIGLPIGTDIRVAVAHASAH